MAKATNVTKMSADRRPVLVTTAASAKPKPVAKIGLATAAKVKADPKATTKSAPKAAPKATAKPAKARTKKPAVISAEQRRCYIEVAAYHIAERRCFAAGDPLADWTQAEAEIDRLLAEGRLGA